MFPKQQAALVWWPLKKAKHTRARFTLGLGLWREDAKPKELQQIHLKQLPVCFL